MGYIEETGAAQLMRDARITTIYEGTTGIQANDFIGRKVQRDGGKELARLLADVRLTLEEMSAHDELGDVSGALEKAVDGLEEVTHWLLEQGANDPLLAGTAAFNYLMGAGTCIGGWLLAKSAIISLARHSEDPSFYSSKIITCRFFAAHVLPRTAGYFDAVKASSDPGLMLLRDAF
jgi:hypothetical protein